VTPLDRLIAAISDDGPIPRREQLDLVDALLRRRIPISQGRPLRAPEPLCSNCKTAFDEDGYCIGCGRQQLSTAPTGLSEPGPPVGAEGGHRR